MRRATAFVLVGLLGIAFAPRVRAEAPAGPTTLPSSDEITALVQKLGDSDFHLRRGASVRLRDIGPSALPALKDAADSHDPEARARATALMRELEYHPVPGRPRQHSGRVASMTVTVGHGRRTVNVDDDGRNIRILDGPGGIEMIVEGEVDGQAAKETYKAATPEDLKDDNPEAYLLYRRFANANNLDIDGNAIQQRVIVRGNMLIVNQPVEAPRTGGDDLTALGDRVDEEMNHLHLTRSQRQRVHDALDDVERARPVVGPLQLGDMSRYNDSCDKLRKALADFKLPDPGDALPPPKNARLGISGNSDFPDAGPVTVSEVMPDSRAQHLGLQPGDIIQKVNGNGIHGIKDLRRLVTDRPTGLVVDVIRDGQEVTLKEQ